MWWIIKYPDRWAAEKAALHALEREVSWLTTAESRLDSELRVVIDFELVARGETFAASLVYPLAFPFVPPSVIPRSKERLSSHQYGSGGELCLEWGPDNWVPEILAVELVRSMERLLSAEAPSEAGSGVAPSRHQLTLGQELRGTRFRGLVTASMTQRLSVLEPGAALVAKFQWSSRPEATVFALVAVSKDGVEWEMDPTVPINSLIDRHEVTGLVVRVPKGEQAPSAVDESLRSRLRAISVLSETYAPGILEPVLVWDAPASLFVFLGDNRGHKISVILSEDEQRIGADHNALVGKTVGIVGCGSVGSKIAVSLARSGVRSFRLFDDDVMLPGNLVRHDLDWTAIGEHKAEALSRRLSLVAPDVAVKASTHRIGGQEASGGSDWAISRLRECDIVIDASADARVFNYLASAIHDANTPFMWVEVFAGGIGGLIARSRPAIDPDPQLGRLRILAWCDEKGIAAPVPAGRGYESGSNAAPMIADDADVSTIASHASRFALDILIGRAPSHYPVSAYLIGLAPGWIFEQPFQTFPINLGLPGPTHPPARLDPEITAELVRLVKERKC